MADERTLHEDKIFAIKQLFTNMAKPRASDFGALIDMADNDPLFVAHSVPGTGNVEFHKDLNTTIDFVTNYNEIHLFIHSVYGTYVFNNFELGAYGKNNQKVTADQFIHIAPSVNIIDDGSLSTEQTFSSQYITENYLDNEALNKEYVSKTKPSLIEKDSNINSASSIFSTNIMSNLRYEQGGTSVDPTGVLRFETGTGIEPILNEIEINPFTDWKVVDVPASGAAPNIAFDYNNVTAPLRTFKRGDLVLLNYDLSAIYDATINSVADYGKRLYILTKDFELEAAPVEITSNADYESVTKLGIHEMKDLFYEKSEIDNKLTSAASGIEKTVDNLDTMDDEADDDAPGNYIAGTQFLVSTYNKSSNVPGGIIQGIPTDTTEDQKQGVFMVVDNAGTNHWAYSYSFNVTHTHVPGDIDGLATWSQQPIGMVHLDDFEDNDSSKHFTKVLLSSYATGLAELASLENIVGLDNTTGLNKKVKDNATNILSLGNDMTKYLPLTGGTLQDPGNLTVKGLSDLQSIKGTRLDVNGECTFKDTTVTFFKSTYNARFDAKIEVVGLSTLASTVISSLTVTEPSGFNSDLTVEGLSTLAITKISSLTVYGNIINNNGITAGNGPGYGNLKFWTGTEAEHSGTDSETIYFITD